MKRRALSIGAVALLIAGFVSGYLVNATIGDRPVNAAVNANADSTAALTTKTVSVAPTSIDAAIEQAYQTAQKSVVFVDNAGQGTGSGIIYDSQGDIVTNDHVVSGGTKFSVTFANGKTVKATLVGTDSADDLAVLHVNTTGLTPATFAASGDYQVAETVLAIGSPLGLQRSVTEGLISGLNRTEQEPTGSYIPDAIQTSAAINPGNSGGALVSLTGQVVGIPTIVQTSDNNGTNVQNVGFAIPSSRITFIVPQIIQSGKVTNTGRAFLGVSVGDASGSSSFANPWGYPQTQTTVAGAVLNDVSATGPAGKAGMKLNDVITTFNGSTITSSDDLLKALAQAKPGQSVSVTYNRSGVNHTTTVVLGELPA